jgi:hypothetical protein
MKKFIDITDEQLEEDMMSGVRSLPIEPLTAIERDEIVNLIKEQGGIAIVDGDFLKTDSPDLYNQILVPYLYKKVKITLNWLD